ncbi:MAG: hypothetical protein ACREX8_08980 [Gammaproteobacteria bacterium]
MAESAAAYHKYMAGRAAAADHKDGAESAAVAYHRYVAGPAAVATTGI